MCVGRSQTGPDPSHLKMLQVRKESFAWRKTGKPTFIWREIDSIWISDKGLVESYPKPTGARPRAKATEAEPRAKVISRNDWAPL